MRTDGTGLIEIDAWLQPFADRLRQRFERYLTKRAEIEAQGGILGPISQGHRYFGFTAKADGVCYREWAPGASFVSLTGDFNGWDRSSHPLQRDERGVWSTLIPAGLLTHGSRVKVHVRSAIGELDRIPAYATRVVTDESGGVNAQYWNPPAPYSWSNSVPDIVGGLRIYEAHPGMALEEQRVGTWPEFTANMLPRIADLGYNAVQLMAVMEHPYYASFGYHVSNFYAPSSRFGTPEDLKALIDAAHGMGLLVIMDLIHSHAVKNVNEGLNLFDGTPNQYFKGEHPAWDSLCFDYLKPEVLRFLLSNVRYWLEEFRFDGFRFDGVTSMLYRDHGLERDFKSYDDYFSDNTDSDSLVYLTLANEVINSTGHEGLRRLSAEVGEGGAQEEETGRRGEEETQRSQEIISIAEDVSGMPGLARPIDEGGLGFDYRLAMGIPDYWIKLLKERRDEDWILGEIYGTLLNRRGHEKHVAYAESHDQALVGDKTIAFQLMDQEMYWHMGVDSRSVVIDRGIALHKLIRFLTFSLGGEGWLSFMGNEFGHPEWIDFPREGNNWSYQHARRQWSLVDNPQLRYRRLSAFDAALMRLDERWNLFGDPLIEQLLLHEDEKLLVYRRGPLVFAINLHPERSYADLRIPVPDPIDYQIVLDSDRAEFGGQARVDPGNYAIQRIAMYGREQSVQIYLPARTAQALAPITWLQG